MFSSYSGGRENRTECSCVVFLLVFRVLLCFGCFRIYIKRSAAWLQTRRKANIQSLNLIVKWHCSILEVGVGNWDRLYLNAARYSASPIGGSRPPVHPTLTLKPSPAPAPTWRKEGREMKWRTETYFTHLHPCQSRRTFCN